MDFPIRSDELTIEMLRGFYTYSNEELYDSFMASMDEGTTYISEGYLEDAMIDFAEEMGVPIIYDDEITRLLMQGDQIGNIDIVQWMDEVDDILSQIRSDEITIEMLRGLYKFEKDWYYQLFMDQIEDGVVYSCDDELEEAMSDFEGEMDEVERDCLLAHKQLMKESIHNELIAVMMHPSRLQKQLDQYDDIEAFFDAIGC